MPKRLEEFKGHLFPCEDQMGILMFLKEECAELERLVTPEHLAIKYYLDSGIVQTACTVLCAHGYLEKRERTVGRRWWNQRKLIAYRRLK